MPAPERVNEEEGGEPQGKAPSAPLHPGGLYLSVEPAMNVRDEPQASPISLFAESASYEWQRSLRGLAQLVGAEGKIAQESEPGEAADLLGQHAQMFGKAVGGLLPTLVIAAGTRYAFGRILAHDVASVENALLKRTPIGLSAAEAGATGFLSGSLLNATQGAAKDDVGQLLFDRLQSGVRSGAEFALMSAGSIGLGKLASTERGAALGADRLMKIAAVNGLVSGAVGGFANVEVDSLARNGRLNFDQRELGKSIYEMSLFGAVFGFGAGMLGRSHDASAAVRRGSGEQLGSRKGAGDLRFSGAIPDGPALAEPAVPLKRFESEPVGRALSEAAVKLDRLESDPAEKLTRQLSGQVLERRAEIDLGLGRSPVALAENGSVAAGEKTSALGRSDAPLAGLQSLLKLNELFGEDSPTMQRLKEMESKSPFVSFERLAAFVSENTEQRVSMLRMLAEQETHSAKFMDDRLDGLSGLSAYYGENSSAIKRLFELENEDMFIFRKLNNFIKGEDRSGNLDRSGAAAGGEPARVELVKELLHAGVDSMRLPGLLEFVQESESNAALVKRLIEGGAPASDLTPPRLSALSSLMRVSGDGSALISKALVLESQGLPLSYLSGFLEDSESSEKGSDSATQAKVKAAFLERLIDAGVGPDQLFPKRLRALFHLNQEFGEGSPTMQSLMTAEADYGLSLHEISAYLRNHPDDGQFVKKLVDSGVTSISAAEIGVLKDLDQLLKTDNHGLWSLLQLRSDVNLNTLRAFLLEAPPELRPVVLQFVHGEGWANRVRLSGAWLKQLAAFNSMFGQEPTRRCVELLSAGQFEGLSLFVEGNPVLRKPLVEEVLKDNPTAADLNVSRLGALLTLKQVFHEQSEVVTRLRELESSPQDLSVLTWFLDYAPDGGKEQIMQMIGEGAPSILFDRHQLAVRYLLERGLGKDSLLIKRILDIADKGDSAGAVFKFLRDGGLMMREEESLRLRRSGEVAGPQPSSEFTASFLQGVRERAEALAAFLDMGQSPQQLTARRLTAINSLSAIYGADASLFKRLFELEGEGLNLGSASAFVGMNSAVNRKLFKEEVEKNAPARLLTMAKLLDRAEVEKLSEYFPSGDVVVNHLGKLQREGLSGSRALQYVSENPADRAPIVERLVQEQVGADRFRELMSLQVLPARVAYALMQAAQDGGTPVPVLLSNLRDWRAGRYFREMLMEHVANEGVLSAPAIERVVESARLAALAAGRERGLTNPLPVKPDFQQAALHPATVKLADILRNATDRINQTIPFDKHIVLLGRDMWPFLPLLKAQGRSVQYFLWSSLQDSADTAPHWLKEVPPHSVVLDSGWSGTIVSKAKLSDPTVTGFLLEKHDGPYKQLLAKPYDHDTVSTIEGATKLIGRTKRLTASGNAVVAKLRDGGAKTRLETPDATDRWRFERDARELFRTLSLSEWDAWRYSQFSGLTPKERLSLNSDAELQEHYRKIEELRRADSNSEDRS